MGASHLEIFQKDLSGGFVLTFYTKIVHFFRSQQSQMSLTSFRQSP